MNQLVVTYSGLTDALMIARNNWHTAQDKTLEPSYLRELVEETDAMVRTIAILVSGQYQSNRYKTIFAEVNQKVAADVPAGQIAIDLLNEYGAGF